MGVPQPAGHLGTSPVAIEKTPRYAWVILAVTYLASICAPLGQFKVTAIASEIIGTYGLGYAEFGMLMTCLAIIGAILAFPAAFICRRIGLRATCAIALGCIIVGGLVEVPCQKRNATAASIALVSAQIALSGVQNLISFDEAVAVMDEVGRGLPFELRESALGGIAAAPSACAWCNACC